MSSFIPGSTGRRPSKADKERERITRELNSLRVAFEAGFRACQRGEDLEVAWRKALLGTGCAPEVKLGPLP